jgi:hypothetical protein
MASQKKNSLKINHENAEEKTTFYLLTIWTQTLVGIAFMTLR